MKRYRLFNPRCSTLAVAALVAACLVGLTSFRATMPETIASRAGAEEPAPSRSTASPRDKQRVPWQQRANKLRERFPFESLSERLSYETRPSQQLDQGVDQQDADEHDTRPRLGAQAAQWLEHADEMLDNSNGPWYAGRRRSLELLHSEQVQSFVEQDGFGVSRMVTPSPRTLDLPPPGPIPFATVPNRSAGDDETEERSPRKRLPSFGAEPAPDGKSWPAGGLLWAFHENGRWNFFNAPGFGYAKDREHVAGFVSHGFRSPHDLAHSAANKAQQQPLDDRWLLRRLELVSLLKQDEPSVYVSKHLPRMNELAEAKTRPLNRFERRALDELRGGEELVSEASTNRIEMLGSLRAAKVCLECHRVRHGELLGAFSYRLEHDPPASLQPASAQPAKNQARDD